MFELDHDLAQDIVDRTMAILPYNVNVMDSQGLILGSGCLLYTSPSPRDRQKYRMPSSA